MLTAKKKRNCASVQECNNARILYRSAQQKISSRITKAYIRWTEISYRYEYKFRHHYKGQLRNPFQLWLIYLQTTIWESHLDSTWNRQVEVHILSIFQGSFYCFFLPNRWLFSMRRITMCEMWLPQRKARKGGRATEKIGLSYYKLNCWIITETESSALNTIISSKSYKEQPLTPLSHCVPADLPAETMHTAAATFTETALHDSDEIENTNRENIFMWLNLLI